MFIGERDEISSVPAYLVELFACQDTGRQPCSETFFAILKKESARGCGPLPGSAPGTSRNLSGRPSAFGMEKDMERIHEHPSGTISGTSGREPFGGFWFQSRPIRRNRVFKPFLTPEAVFDLGGVLESSEKYNMKFKYYKEG